MTLNSKMTPAPVVDINEVSHVSSGTVIKGEISSLTDIRLDGRIEGTVFTEGKIVIGEGAALSGTLACTSVDLWGKIEGDIYVKDTFSLKESASVNGNIHVRKFQVEMGAQLNGTVAMISEDDYSRFVKDVISVPAPSPAL